MLETKDIQHILLTRTPALTGRYEFLSFRDAAGGRAWLSAVLDKVKSAAEVLTSVDTDKRWVTVALTWNGLRALGVDEASLATFPEEFKQGMVARAEMLGDTGENHPGNWAGPFKESLGWRGGWHRDGSRPGSRERPRAVQAAPAPSAGPCCATLPAPAGRSRSALGRRPRASSRPGASATGSQSPNARAQATAAPPGRPARG